MTSPKQEMENLRFLSSEIQIQEGVSKIAGTFGKVQSVAPLALENGHDQPGYAFFVNFENTRDAMTAAKDLKGLLYGFSGLVVKIHKQEQSQPA